MLKTVLILHVFIVTCGCITVHSLRLIVVMRCKFHGFENLLSMQKVREMHVVDFLSYK